jgi:Holliday junction resolvasome RuvABC endonuclease subunit
VTDARRILALDLSLTRTGVCRPDGRCACIRTDKLRGLPRIDHIVRQVQALACGVDLVVIEGYSFGSQGRSVFDIAELGGCVRFLLHRLGMRYVDVPPATLKKFATGKGNAPKDAMIAEAIRRFGFPGSDNNEADAYLLWCLACHAYGAPVARVPVVQAEAAAKVAWPLIERARCA